MLHRDRDSEGSVTLDAQGRRIIRYTLRDHDSQALTTGLTHAFDVLLSAGATELFSSSSAAPPFQLGERRDDDKQGEHALHGTIADPAYRAHITTIKRTRVRAPLNTPLASAHQMSTCRMASTPHLGACRPTGQLWESDDVWVCDASLFPTASGVNPMLTNYAISDGVARACVEYLGKKLGRVGEKYDTTVQE